MRFVECVGDKNSAHDDLDEFYFNKVISRFLLALMSKVKVSIKF